MEFSMRLNPLPFSMIASGKKTFELRLYDEKRQKIAVGDTIRFTDVSDATRALYTKVKDLFIFPSFDALYKALPLVECGYTADSVKQASPEDMRQYYSPEQEKQYGVLAIKIEVIPQVHS